MIKGETGISGLREGKISKIASNWYLKGILVEMMP
jgi:hypothetical protein